MFDCKEVGSLFVFDVVDVVVVVVIVVVVCFFLLVFLCFFFLTKMCVKLLALQRTSRRITVSLSL